MLVLGFNEGKCMCYINFIYYGLLQSDSWIFCCKKSKHTLHFKCFKPIIILKSQLN